MIGVDLGAGFVDAPRAGQHAAAPSHDRRPHLRSRIDERRGEVAHRGEVLGQRQRDRVTDGTERRVQRDVAH